MEIELKSTTSIFCCFEQDFFFIKSQRLQRQQSIENKCIFVTMNFYIQLYGKLEKQIKKSCWMLEINKAVSQKWICRGADSKKNVWAIIFQRFLLGSISFKIQYWASLWLSGKESACQCRRQIGRASCRERV